MCLGVGWLGQDTAARGGTVVFDLQGPTEVDKVTIRIQYPLSQLINDGEEYIQSLKGTPKCAFDRILQQSVRCPTRMFSRWLPSIA